ncbi:MAG: type III secretion protein [Myxococcaceae bacterium]|nr:type III secretion protein [Myxococcaceae bacterium]
MNTRRLVVAGVLALFVSGCSVELHHGLTEEDANDIYVLLQENGINATKILDNSGNEPTFTITVSKQDASAAARLLKEYSLPRPKIVGLESFRMNAGMIPTETEERAKFLEAMQGEVTKALNKIDGVLEAKAIVMIPEQNDLTQPEAKPVNTASVLVKYRPIGERPPLTEKEIKAFVAKSLPDMKEENVAVILSQALPPQAVASPESQLKDVLGFRMTAASANTFRIVVVVAVLLFLTVSAFAVMQTLRSGSPQATSSRPRRRTAADS